MALIAVASAKGSPGATTASLLIGALWPRQVVVAECDPAGGDVAHRMPGPDGRPLDPQQGMLSLVAAGRRSLHPGLLAAHTQQIVGGLDVLSGVMVPEQAGALAQQWERLADLFARLPGTDVVADLGRIGAATPQNVLLASAAAIVLVVGTVPSEVVHLRERLRAVHEAHGGPMGAPIHVLVVAAPKRSRTVKEVREAIERSEVPVAGVHHLAHDPSGAAFFLGQVSGSPARTALVRSARPVVDELAAATAAFHVRAEEPAGDQPASGEVPA